MQHSPSLCFCSELILCQGATESKKPSSCCLAARLEVPRSRAAWLGFFTTYHPSWRGYLRAAWQQTQSGVKVQPCRPSNASACTTSCELCHKARQTLRRTVVLITHVSQVATPSPRAPLALQDLQPLPVAALLHLVWLGQHTQCAQALGVGLTRHAQHTLQARPQGEPSLNVGKCV